MEFFFMDLQNSKKKIKNLSGKIVCLRITKNVQLQKSLKSRKKFGISCHSIRISIE